MDINSPLPSDVNTLQIGDIIVSKKAELIIWTVLGSCISVIFHVPGTISVMCHAQMPFRADFKYQCFDSCPHPCFKSLPDSLDYKYVSCSIEYMVNTLKENNIKTDKVKTTLIGGAAVLLKMKKGESIGEKNTETARKLLEKYNIPINRELTGGTNGFTLWYYTKDDRLFVRRHDAMEKFELFSHR